MNNYSLFVQQWGGGGGIWIIKVRWWWAHLLRGFSFIYNLDYDFCTKHILFSK